ncbi:MAG: DUF1566 domain-containing protein [Methylococcaceae bacterium]
MLDNHPRHQLRFIIDNYGRSIIDDPRRCRGMLKDLAPKHQRETNLLMLALEQKLVAELTQKTHTPILMHLDILAQRLHNNIGIQKDFAVWAIESWALALDVIQQPSAQKIITPEPEPKIIIPPKPAPIVSTSPLQQIGKFIVQDGVATDPETGLMWLRFAHGQRWENGTVSGDVKGATWDDAIKIPVTFNQQGYAGCNDWRVPNIDELKTLIDMLKGKEGNYIDADVFPKNKNWFWSSSPYGGSNLAAWGVYFSYGYSYGNDTKGYDYERSKYVRLVRG